MLESTQKKPSVEHDTEGGESDVPEEPDAGAGAGAAGADGAAAAGELAAVDAAGAAAALVAMVVGAADEAPGAKTPPGLLVALDGEAAFVAEDPIMPPAVALEADPAPLAGAVA